MDGIVDRDTLAAALDKEVGAAQGFIHRTYRTWCVDNPELVRWYIYIQNA